MNISFLICTYNSPKLIKKCIDSILKQNYLGEKEILLVDGGSDEKTKKVIGDYISKFNFIRLIENKNRLPEGEGNGKWLGWKQALGNYVFIIDQDNELVDKNAVRTMLDALKEDKVFGCSARLELDKKDGLSNRYVSLVGTDPVFAYRSIDGLINLKEEIFEDKGKLKTFKINKNNPIIAGGNCFVYKKPLLDVVGGYTQDTENIVKLVNWGINTVAITTRGVTHHRAIKGFFEFIKKKKKWAKTYKPKKERQLFSYYPKNNVQRKELILNLFYIFLFFPNILVSIKNFLKTREVAWFMHPVLSFITGFIYLIYTVFIGKLRCLIN